MTTQQTTRPAADADTVPEADASRDRVQKLGGAPPVRDWDRYELVSLLGRGGMGAVYEARDRRLDRRVAIKFIHGGDPYTTLRFLQEARAQARVDHPNVCKVVEVGEVEGKAYIAMQLVRGKSLSEAAGDMSTSEKVHVMKTVAEAVHAAHLLGVIHRDIKPANIMVEEEPSEGGSRTLRPVLMDFGLAREAGDRQGLTESGAVMGTPSYMPPEQARGDTRSVDRRSDVYSLGATLYHLLAGEPPFVQDEHGNVLLKVLIQDPIPLREKAPSVPEALDVIVGKCLNKEPHQRYDTAADLAADLDRFLAQKRVVARRLSLITRLYWRGKRNKPMAFAVLALSLSLLAFAGYGVRTTIVNARNERIARERAALAQKLGQSVKDLEWLVRSAYLVPLHDTTPEKAMVRARMTAIQGEVRSFGALSMGLDRYALGRGHLALEEWDEARVELEAAESQGVREPELDYALGRVLGELYIRALTDARRSGDKSYFEKQKQELDRTYLAPALARLTRCRGIESVPVHYLEGLIDFYHRRYDEALANAALARKGAPWLYEAAKLEGDVLMARALDARDHGDNALAQRHFAEAVGRYEQAADIGRSDHQIYEALAEAWIRQEEMDTFAGQDPAPKLDKALAASDKALTAAPAESHGHTKKAFAHYFQAQHTQNHGAPRTVVEAAYRAQIAAGERGSALHPKDAYAHEITGLAYTQLAGYLLDQGQLVDGLLDQAFARLAKAIQIQPRFPWAHNDYGIALGYAGENDRRQNKDPRIWYDKAIDSMRKATELDDGYSMAYNNMSSWLTELADWQANHGESPEKAVREAVEMAERAIRINKQNPYPYANAGLAVLKMASFKLDAGQDGRESAQAAIRHFDALLGIDPKFVLAHRELGRARLLLASNERAQNVDPRASLEAALSAIAACHRLEAGNAECKAVEAQVRAEQAAFAKQRGETFLPALEQAESLSAEAAQKLPDRWDLWLIVAEIALQRAETSPAAKPGPTIEEGLRAVDKALAKAPGLPKALAIQGALLVRKAEAEKDAAERKATLSRAKESLSKAFAANPLLAKRHGAAAAEADRLAGAP